MTLSSLYSSPIGNIGLTTNGNALTELWLEGQKHLDPKNFSPSVNHPVLQETREWLNDYFSGKRPPISLLKLAPSGGTFRQTVWRLLREIPYGETVSYGELARETARLLGKSTMSAQAIGGAVGHNPISIIIPCHRVIGVHGNLTGYAGGLALKIKLLEHEGVDMTSLFRLAAPR